MYGLRCRPVALHTFGCLIKVGYDSGDNSL